MAFTVDSIKTQMLCLFFKHLRKQSPKNLEELFIMEMNNPGKTSQISARSDSDALLSRNLQAVLSTVLNFNEFLSHF